MLSQRFAVPVRPTKPVLYISYWLASDIAGGGKAAHHHTGPPAADDRRCQGPSAATGHHRARIGSTPGPSFKLPLPAGARQISLTIAIPAQPRGDQVLLVIDSIAIGS